MASCGFRPFLEEYLLVHKPHVVFAPEVSDDLASEIPEQTHVDGAAGCVGIAQVRKDVSRSLSTLDRW